MNTRKSSQNSRTPTIYVLLYNSYCKKFPSDDMTFENFMGDDDLMVEQDEELSAISNEEASKVFEEWKTDELDEIMDIDVNACRPGVYVVVLRSAQGLVASRFVKI